MRDCVGTAGVFNTNALTFSPDWTPLRLRPQRNPCPTPSQVPYRKMNPSSDTAPAADARPIGRIRAHVNQDPVAVPGNRRSESLHEDAPRPAA